MALKATVSTNIPADPDRKTRTAVREAAAAGAKLHHVRHMPWHFESFAPQKYGYKNRSKDYLDLKRKLGLSANPLDFSGTTKREILGSYQITVTGTRGAQLRMKCSLLGATTGRVLDISAIERLLKSESKQHDRSRLARLLERLKKTGGRMTFGQEQAVHRNAELTAIAGDELKAIANEEEQVFKAAISKPDPMRTV